VASTPAPAPVQRQSMASPHSRATPAVRSGTRLRTVGMPRRQATTLHLLQATGTAPLSLATVPGISLATMLPGSVPRSLVLLGTVLLGTVLLCTVLLGTVLLGTVPLGTVLLGTVLLGTVLLGTVLLGTVVLLPRSSATAPLPTDPRTQDTRTVARSPLTELLHRLPSSATTAASPGTRRTPAHHPSTLATSVGSSATGRSTVITSSLRLPPVWAVGHHSLVVSSATTAASQGTRRPPAHHRSRRATFVGSPAT
jgi:uncharacterized membrane protein